MKIIFVLFFFSTLDRIRNNALKICLNIDTKRKKFVLFSSSLAQDYVTDSTLHYIIHYNACSIIIHSTKCAAERTKCKIPLSIVNFQFYSYTFSTHLIYIFYWMYTIIFMVYFGFISPRKYQKSIILHFTREIKFTLLFSLEM